jgi:hypothetical protein
VKLTKNWDLFELIISLLVLGKTPTTSSIHTHTHAYTTLKRNLCGCAHGEETQTCVLNSAGGPNYVYEKSDIN